jgi:hypothetical protein
MMMRRPPGHCPLLAWLNGEYLTGPHGTWTECNSKDLKIAYATPLPFRTFGSRVPGLQGSRFQARHGHAEEKKSQGTNE